MKDRTEAASGIDGVLQEVTYHVKLLSEANEQELVILKIRLKDWKTSKMRFVENENSK